MTQLKTIGLIGIVALVVAVVGLLYEHAQVAKLQKTLAAVQTDVMQLASVNGESHQSTVATDTALMSVAQTSQKQAPVAQKTQNQQLQDAVSNVTPAVVSIVESKEVPRLRVTYENPFGNDPLFGAFGLQVPVYQQIGTTTRQVSAGTGFIVRSSGYIVTNKHVVPDVQATYTVLLSNGSQKSGKVVWRSTTVDLAVLKITGTGYATIPLGNSDTLRLGEGVFAIGNALGEYNNTVSVGVVSGLDRTITAAGGSGVLETLSGAIQTDAAINLGNSGGPLVNLSGAAVGVNIASALGSQNIGFALPIKEVNRALNSLGI